MLKIKEKITTSNYSKNLSCSLSERYNLNSKSVSVKNHSNDQVIFPKCSSKFMQGQTSGIILKSKIESCEASHKKQQYFDTENQMIEQNKRWFQFGQNAECFRRNYQSCQKIKTRYFCRQFAEKLRRRIQNRPIGSVESRLSYIESRTSQGLQISKFQQFTAYASMLWKLAILVQFFIICLISAFSNLGQLKQLLVLRFLAAIICFINQVCQTKSSLQTFHLFQYLTSPSINKLSFMVNILSTILWFTSASEYLSYLDLSYCLFCLHTISICQEILFRFITKRRIFSLFQHLTIINLVTKMMVFSHIIIVILIKLYFSSLQKNWLIMTQQSILGFPQIYSWCFSEAISIIFTYGFYMPSPANSIESIVFSVIRVSAILISLNNITKFLNHCLAVYHKKVDSQYSLLSSVKSIAQNSKMKNEQYEQLIQLTNLRIEEFKGKQEHNQKAVADFLSFLPQKHQSQIKSQKSMPRIKLITKAFPCMTKKMKIQLSECMSQQALYKGQVFQDFTHSYDFFFLKRGRMAHISLSRTPFQIEIQQMDQNQVYLLNNNFMKKTLPNYGLKCLSSAIIVRLREQDFRRIIRNSQADFQYIWTLHDTGRHLLNQFQTTNCRNCYYNHSQFQCPKLHYSPFKSQVICNYLAKKTSPKKPFFIDTNKRISRLKSSALKLFAIYYSLMSPKKESLFHDSFYFNQNEDSSQKDFRFQYEYLIQSMAEKMYLKAKQLQIQKDEVWTLKSDVLYDYRTYFKRFNPSNLNGLTLQTQADIL